jgi:hypothetical protein
MKIINAIQYLYLVSILIFFSYYVFCMTYPYKVVDNMKDAQTVKNTLYTGEDMLYVIDYCKYMNLSPVASRQLVGEGIIYNLNNTSARAPLGCNIAIINPGKTPDVATGTYYLKIHNEFTVNPFRKIVVEFKSNEFKIINND